MSRRSFVIGVVCTSFILLVERSPTDRAMPLAFGHRDKRLDVAANGRPMDIQAPSNFRLLHTLPQQRYNLRAALCRSQLTHRVVMPPAAGAAVCCFVGERFIFVSVPWHCCLLIASDVFPADVKCATWTLQQCRAQSLFVHLTQCATGPLEALKALSPSPFTILLTTPRSACLRVLASRRQ